MTATRPIIVRLLLLLIGGAIVNVAVAWGCAYYDGRRYIEELLGYPEDFPQHSHPLPPLGGAKFIWLDDRPLPVVPIWPAFAINTICHAAILWLLFAAPFKLRRWRRIKRGLCPKCAYPVGASEVCTECGLALSASPR